MSEGFEGNLERQSEEVPDAYFEANREANLRFPQQTIGLAILTAAAALEDKDFDVRRFARMELSDDQQHELGRAMNAAHLARGVRVVTHTVPEDLVATAEERYPDHMKHGLKPLDDDRLVRLWQATRRNSLLAIASVSGFERDNMPYVIAKNIDKFVTQLSGALADPVLRERVTLVFESFKGTLDSADGYEISKEMHETIDKIIEYSRARLEVARADGGEKDMKVVEHKRDEASEHLAALSQRLFNRMIEACEASGIPLSYSQRLTLRSIVVPRGL